MNDERGMDLATLVSDPLDEFPALKRRRDHKFKLGVKNQIGLNLTDQQFAEIAEDVGMNLQNCLRTMIRTAFTKMRRRKHELERKRRQFTTKP